MKAAIIDLELIKLLREAGARRRAEARKYQLAVVERVQARDCGKVIQFPRRGK